MILIKQLSHIIEIVLVTVCNLLRKLNKTKTEDSNTAFRTLLIILI